MNEDRMAFGCANTIQFNMSLCESTATSKKRRKKNKTKCTRNAEAESMFSMQQDINGA